MNENIVRIAKRKIPAAVKKCKHCGKWLTKQTNAPEAALADNRPKAKAEVSSVAGTRAKAAPAAVRPTNDDLHVQTFFTPYAWLPLCCGVLGSILPLFELAGGYLLYGFSSLIFFCAFYEGMKWHAKPVGWPLMLVIIECGILCIAATAVALYPELMKEADEPLMLYDLIFMSIICSPWSVLGLKLIRNYSGNIARLGWAILLVSIVQVLTETIDLQTDIFIGPVISKLFIKVFRIIFSLGGWILIFEVLFDVLFRIFPTFKEFMKYLPYFSCYISIGIVVLIVFSGITMLEPAADCYLFYCFYILTKEKKA